MAFHHPDILQLQSDYVDVKYIDSDLRPEFPEDGATCNVAKCETDKFTSHRAYVRHWNLFHQPLAKLFVCSLCPSVKSPRRGVIVKHVRIHHNNMNASVNVSEEESGKFIDPLDVLPYRTSYKKPINTAGRDYTENKRYCELPEEIPKFDNVHLDQEIAAMPDITDREIRVTPRDDAVKIRRSHITYTHIK